MVNCPIPKTLKSLRVFLGLTSYYRQFIKDYGKLSEPLMNLLKKDNFKWDDEATKAQEAFKATMTSALVLMMPYCKKPFILETNACDTDIGAFLCKTYVLLPTKVRP